MAERALRPGVLWHKGSFGSDSAAGSRFAERLLTVVATCRQQGRSLLHFLVAANEAALKGTTAPSLLPTPPGSVNGYEPRTLYPEIVFKAGLDSYRVPTIPRKERFA